MSSKKILVVDDEEDICDLLKYNLSKEGYKVICAHSGEDALKLTKAENPNLILLDLMLPGIDGLEVCKTLKNDPNTKNIQILILSAKGEEADIVIGLELGADDYIVKPFSLRVLSARIKALLRRKSEQNTTNNVALVSFAGIKINVAKHEVHIDNKLVELTSTEFKILLFLAKQPGWVFTRTQIVEAVHGDDYPVTERSIDVQVVNLRKKLANYGDLLETVRGVGYRFKELITEGS